ncbi:hypothetical protein RJ45_02790 [Photobacterium gaetbulicola]|uniref:Uncharacterized protein n=1 Tax=Photobacterium gaetbulicola TaxID=1295392 RepID=A0A0B9GK34_9GAMM|nr:hypothetical protein RJ45_02790 [Photobacterium gaetbulicola]
MLLVLIRSVVTLYLFPSQGTFQSLSNLALIYFYACFTWFYFDIGNVNKKGDAVYLSGICAPVIGQMVDICRREKRIAAQGKTGGYFTEYCMVFGNLE